MKTILFLLKKIITSLILPVGLIILVLFTGCILRFRRPDGRSGPVLVIIAGLLLLGLSLPCTGKFLLRNLEAQAGPKADPQALVKLGVKHIVVLSGGANDLSDPVDSLSVTSLKRVLEGIRLKKEMPGAFLVLSGGNIAKDMNSAEVMASYCREAGLDRSTFILETSSRDTEDQARFLKPLMADSSFALVTSASHMPRSIMIFRRYGLTPIPSPADFHNTRVGLNIFNYLPAVTGLFYSELAIKEYIGMFYYRLKAFWSNRPDPAETGGVIPERKYSEAR